VGTLLHRRAATAANLLHQIIAKVLTNSYPTPYSQATYKEYFSIRNSVLQAQLKKKKVSWHFFLFHSVDAGVAFKYSKEYQMF